jgi:hypothetical protein
MTLFDPILYQKLVSIPVLRQLQGHVLTIDLYKTRSAKTHYFSVVAIPESYQSIFANDHDLFAEMQFQIDSQKVYIDMFQNHTYGTRTLLSKEEQTFAKGLGAIILCKTFQYLVMQKFVRKSTPVELEASGPRCDDFLSVYQWTEEKIDAYIMQYPNVEEDLVDEYDVDDLSEIPIEDKRIEVCKLVDNNRLISYYESFGFRVNVHYGFSADMETTVARILNACTVKTVLDLSGQKRARSLEGGRGKTQSVLQRRSRKRTSRKKTKHGVCQASKTRAL